MFSVVGAGLKRPPAVQTSEVRNQISDAVQAGFTRCNGFAVNRISYPVGAGLKRPPARKLVFAIGHGEYQNRNFHNRHKLFSSRTLLGRALKTRPYNGCVTFSRRHCCVESSRTDSVRRIPPAATMGFLPFFRIL